MHLDDNTSSVETPANAYLLLDKGGEPSQELYNYASVVGMLGYLQGHSRADITFAVLQVFCYIFCPKHSHELALERIGRYLKGTIKEGIILQPNRKTDKFNVDIYVDRCSLC